MELYNEVAILHLVRFAMTPNFPSNRLFLPVFFFPCEFK
jgi:hypothetical protein